jgi:hypothetical protein
MNKSNKNISCHFLRRKVKVSVNTYLVQKKKKVEKNIKVQI